MKKTVGTEVTYFHYDYNGNLISETDGTGSPVRDYIYLNGEPVAMKLYGTGAGWYWFLNDHLGTPQKIVNASGTVVWEAGYMPFGEARILIADIENNLRFPGQYYDRETGLHYNYHRYYDPDTGRYLTPDPIGLEGGINLYAYVNGNPVNWADVNGLKTIIVITYDSYMGAEFGSHAAVYVDDDGEGERTLYDPAGSYMNSTRGSGGIIQGKHLFKYMKYHQSTGSRVELFIFDTTVSQQSQIIEKASKIGDLRGFSCASSVSTALSGIGPFKNLTPVSRPGILAEKIQELKK